MQIKWNSLKNVKHISSQLLDSEFCSVGIIAEYAERQNISHSESVQNATLSILKYVVHTSSLQDSHEGINRYHLPLYAKIAH
jgi:hypothetical protein